MNIIGIDFEDWYHPELVKRNIKDEKHEPSVLNGIDKILDLLRKHDTFATFFCRRRTSRISAGNF